MVNNGHLYFLYFLYFLQFLQFLYFHAKNVRHGAENVRHRAKNVRHCTKNVRHGALKGCCCRPVGILLFSLSLTTLRPTIMVITGEHD